MKRRILCIFSLVLFLLLFCTCLAPAVERNMATLVDVKQVKSTNTARNTYISTTATKWGEVTELFQVVEGTGWNSGMRVDAVAQQYYSSYFGGGIELHPGEDYTVILTASRTPRVGDLVEVVEAQESKGEQLIVYFPEGTPELPLLQNNFQVTAQGETGMLLTTIGIKMPFFEHRMKIGLDRIQAEGMRVYSYTEALQFLRMLPLVAAVFGLFLLGLFLWGCGCRFSREHAAFGWGNAGLCALIFLGISPAADAIDLPASLMPENSILELDHYFREFQNIFTVLEQLGDTTLTALRTQTLLHCAGILTAFAALAAALLFAQHRLCRKLQEH